MTIAQSLNPRRNEITVPGNGNVTTYWCIIMSPTIACLSILPVKIIRTSSLVSQVTKLYVRVRKNPIILATFKKTCLLAGIERLRFHEAELKKTRHTV